MKRRGFAAAVVTGCGLALAVAAAAGSPEGSTQLHLAPIEFSPAASGTNYVVAGGGLGGLCTLAGAGYFVRALALPRGARVERITVYFEDRDPGAMGMMSLIRRNHERLEALAVTPVSAGTGDVESLSTSDIREPVLEVDKYAYLLQVVLTGPGVCLRGAEVTYRLP